MPSYRYTREIKPEDLRPEQPPELKGKEKAKNWWHYHRVLILVGLLVALLVAFFIRDIVTKVDPDYKLGVLAPYNLPDGLLKQLETGLAAYVDDRNGDGQVVVAVEVYTIQEGGDGAAAASGAMAQTQDPYSQMAGVVRLTAAFEEGNPVIFLAEPQLAEQYQAMYQLYGTEAGQMADEAVPVEELTVAFGDVPALAALDLTFDPYGDGQMVDGHQFLDDFRLGTRAYTGTRLESSKNGPELWAYTLQLLERLKAGSPA